jgi:hypothetical protein
MPNTLYARRIGRWRSAAWGILLLGSGLPLCAQGADDTEALKKQVEELEKKVQEIETAQAEQKNVESVTHLAGYAAVGYADGENDDGSFNQVQFNPIFHYMYKDLILLDAELEIAVDENGETSTELETGTINWFINDWALLAAGKFLSPIGQFRQNLHPAWINKFASAPLGFGHDGAAPVSEIGAQVRGGVRIGNRGRLNYAAYVSNGPIVEIDGTDIHLEAEGSTGNADGEFVYGGRIGYLPLRTVEIGVSAATGDVAPEGEEDLLRDYEVYDVDFSWQPGSGWDVRGEYAKTKVGENSASAAPESADWRTWYVQGEYRFLPSKWEAVLRYSDFDSAEDEEDQEQWGIGVNFWFSPSAVAKIDYELNDGLTDTEADDDRVLLQLAYGF